MGRATLIGDFAAGKVMKDYCRDSITLALKWGPWVEPGHNGFTPMDLSPQACKLAASFY